jgi:putative hydrolase of the HAD superfamily
VTATRHRGSAYRDDVTLDKPTAGAVSLDDLSSIEAVVFDIGGVFLVRDHGAIRDAVRRAGLDLPDDPERYLRAHHAGVRAISELLADVDALTESEHTWSQWERGYLTSLGVPPEQLDAGVRALIEVASDPTVPSAWRRVLDHNVAGFHRIVASGIPVAVVSNNDGTAEDQLRRFGICQVGAGPLPAVTVVVDSRLVGVAKPDPAIFRPALAALGTAPERTLYVGDTVHADVRGATAAGMPVVQLDPYDHHADFDHLRLPDVGALADLLLAGQ